MLYVDIYAHNFNTLKSLDTFQRFFIQIPFLLRCKVYFWKNLEYMERKVIDLFGTFFQNNSSERRFQDILYQHNLYYDYKNGKEDCSNAGFTNPIF